jgi:FMN phosphatase YigB (HAD superfamily)
MTFENIQAVGFDLDGTLYPGVPEIDNRVRTQISQKLMGKDPSLKNIEIARSFFEKRYLELHSGTRILAEVGYDNASEIMDDCLARADVLDLIKPNLELFDILEKLKEKYVVYLLTSSPKNLSLLKLEKLGINPNVFDFMFCSDFPREGLSKTSGAAFDYVIEKIGIDAKSHLFFGDRKKSDIIPAKSKGMKTVAVWKEVPEADLSIKNINQIDSLLL